MASLPMYIEPAEANGCKCGQNAGQAPHTCPYSEDINDDHETLCTCCDYCTDQCAWDI